VWALGRKHAFANNKYAHIHAHTHKHKLTLCGDLVMSPPFVARVQVSADHLHHICSLGGTEQHGVGTSEGQQV
jgi:hypothetical protein